MFDPVFNGIDVLALFALPVALWFLVPRGPTIAEFIEEVALQEAERERDG